MDYVSYMQFLFNIGSKNRWICCRFCAIILFLYIIFIHFLLLIYRRDLEWMPTKSDELRYATDLPSKKHPDGPLLINDGIPTIKYLVKEKLKENLNEKINIEYKIIELKQKNIKKLIKPLPINQSFLKKFKKTAKLLNQRSKLPGNFILFGGVLNRAYLELTMNWLCNIYALPIKNKKQNEGNIYLLNATLLVGLDNGKICSQIKKTWPQVTCLSLFEANNNNTKIDFEEQKALDEPLNWGRLRYVQILNTRAMLLSKLGEESLPFVLAESDAIWLRNPFEKLFSKVNLLDDVDLVLPLNSPINGELKGQRFAFDPMIVFPTNASRLALQKLNNDLNNFDNNKKEDLKTIMDQDILNQLCSSQYAGLICRDFDMTDIADGSWFKLSETERQKKAKIVGHWPFIVNNNYYVGVHNKMARQAINGLWFLTTKQKQCNLSKARRVLKKFEKKNYNGVHII
ncbi:hypothetical protein Mgra_00002505, partial [Meloidogyne graminicola]